MAFISKVNIGGIVYDIKDAATLASLTQLITDLGTAAYQDVTTSISDEAGKIADAKTVKEYVDAQVGQIHTFEYEVVQTLPEATEDTMYKIYLVPDSAGADPDFYEEYITIHSGASYTWEKIGDTNIGISGYVPTSRTIAGLTLSADISQAQLRTALGLGALAYKASASGTITGIATGVSTQKYTPAGSINITAGGTTGTVVTGTVSKPTATVSPVTTSIRPVTAVGSAPSVSEVKASFAKSGVTITMGDNETLMIAAATTADALTSTGFNPGAVPTLGTAQDVITDVSVEVSTPTFSGGRIAAAFAGTEVDITPSLTTESKTVTVS